MYCTDDPLAASDGMKMIRNAGCGKDHCAAIVTNTLQMNLHTTSTVNGSVKYAWKDISGSWCLKNERRKNE